MKEERLETDQITPSITNTNENKDPVPKGQRNKSKSNSYKAKKCKVISYNRLQKTLDVVFDGYGIRIKGVTNCGDDCYITVKYKGEIGKPNFVYTL